MPGATLATPSSQSTRARSGPRRVSSARARRRATSCAWPLRTAAPRMTAPPSPARPTAPSSVSRNRRQICRCVPTISPVPTISRVPTVFGRPAPHLYPPPPDLAFALTPTVGRTRPLPPPLPQVKAHPIDTNELCKVTALYIDPVKHVLVSSGDDGFLRMWDPGRWARNGDNRPIREINFNAWVTPGACSHHLAASAHPLRPSTRVCPPSTAHPIF